LSLGVAAARPSPLFTPDPRAEKGGSVGAELARGQIKITPAFTSALSTLSSQHPACPSQEHLKSCPVYQRNQRGVSSALRVPSRHNIVTRAATERGARALMVKCRRLVPPTPNKTSATTISARHRAAGIAIWVGVGAGAGAGADPLPPRGNANTVRAVLDPRPTTSLGLGLGLGLDPRPTTSLRLGPGPDLGLSLGLGLGHSRHRQAHIRCLNRLGAHIRSPGTMV
jgi:hypothetical protein